MDILENNVLISFKSENKQFNYCDSYTWVMMSRFQVDFLCIFELHGNEISRITNKFK